MIGIEAPIAQLASIVRYPVKSFSGASLDTVELIKGRGLPLDRMWAFISSGQSAPEDGLWVPCSTFERLTIRPLLAGMQATANENGVTLQLRDGTSRQVFEGGTAAINGEDVVLARAKIGYWDHEDASLSIINLATVRAIESSTGVSVDPERFRGNLLIEAAPWSEFSWVGCRVSIGDAVLDIVRPIDRCRATSVEPGTGIIGANIPALLMRHFGHAYCGVYARVATGGKIASRDSISLAGTTPSEALRSAADQATAPKIVDWPRLAIIEKIIEEVSGVRSLHLNDRLATLGAWGNYEPGQHIRLHSLTNDGTWRAYTVSGYNTETGTLRVTIKRDSGPGSRAIHELSEGATVLMSGPLGDMTLDNDAPSVLFLTAGIGITPAAAMIPVLAGRPALFVHVSREAKPALWNEVEVTAQNTANIRAELYTTGSDGAGRPDLAAIAQDAAEAHSFVIICGPIGFNEAATTSLRAAGVPDDRIASETFVSSDISTELNTPELAGPFRVRFERSGKEAIWRASDGTLLDLAEANGLLPSSHCRAGLCGSCRAAIINGQAVDLREEASSANQKETLACCSVPNTDIVLDI
ncbi:MAG TPA: hypothetical protein DIT67_10880 [Octadecabacter sp.]|nr:hypothetical protein [Octadecabacter sp.]